MGRDRSRLRRRFGMLRAPPGVDGQEGAIADVSVDGTGPFVRPARVGAVRWVDSLGVSRRGTGRKRSGRQIRNYINAYKVSELLVQASVDGADLDVSHLQQIADSHCESDEDRVELAKRVIEAKTPVRKIKGLSVIRFLPPSPIPDWGWRGPV